MGSGFSGIQFGWDLQMGNLRARYEYLVASESSLPLLWLAASLTGLIAQPMASPLSDRTRLALLAASTFTARTGEPRAAS